MSGSAAAALAELENFGYSKGKAPAAAQDEAPPPKRQRAPARSSEALLAEAEADLESSQVEVAQIDENSMKRMVLSIEKRINENMQLRTKYADTPERFMDSELELYQELKRLHALATAPELYPTFVRTRCVPSLLGLLAHENSDISIDVVDLLREMAESEDALPEDLLVLVTALLDNGAARTHAHPHTHTHIHPHPFTHTLTRTLHTRTHTPAPAPIPIPTPTPTP